MEREREGERESARESEREREREREIERWRESVWVGGRACVRANVCMNGLLIN